MYRRVVTCTTLTAALCAAPWSSAEDTPKGAPPKPNAPNVKSLDDVNTDVENVQPADTKRKGNVFVHRASKIEGMEVRDNAGKKIGSVKDIVIDMGAGRVKYAALSYGGFLGVGDKLFAIPWDAFGHGHDVEENSYFLTLRVDEETLKRAPGFDQDKWPNFASADFRGGIDQYYDKYRTRGLEERAAAEAGKGAKARAAADTVGDLVHRASTIDGMEVRNASGIKLGDVDDLVVEVESGRVRYAALSYGGFLGLGDKLFAVPWGAFKTHFDSSESEHYLVLPMDEATLRKATGFNKDAWPNFADSKITEELDRYYERKEEAKEAVRAKDTR